MYSVSDAFLAAVRTSHQIVAKVEVWGTSGLEDTITGYVDEGSVSVDARRGTRRTCQLTIGDFDGTLTPETANDLLNPLSSRELRLYRGVDFGTTQEYVPLGVFRITKTTPSEGEGGIKIAVDGSDRSWRVKRAQFSGPYTVLADTAVEDAIADLLLDRYPTVETSFPATGAVTPRLALGVGGTNATDPWTAAQKMATDAGYDLYFNNEGVAVMVQTSDLYTATPVVTYGPGEAEVILSSTREWDAETTYNGVIATGEGSGLTAAVRAEVWDDDPTSPTYRYGPFGEIPEMYSSSLIKTAVQAEAAASERLRRNLGTGGKLSWTQVVNPAHDGSDVVAVTRPAINVNDIFVIDSLTIPLKAGSAGQAAGRTRVLIEGN